MRLPSSMLTSSVAGHDSMLVQARDLGAVEAKHLGENLVGMSPKRRCGPDRLPLETTQLERRARHQVLADAGLVYPLEEGVGARASRVFVHHLHEAPVRSPAHARASKILPTSSRR